MRRLVAADAQLEVSIDVGLQVLDVDEAGRLHLAVGLIAAFLRADAQVRDGAAIAADDVIVVTLDLGERIEVVRVVGADLAGLVRRQEKAREVRVGELQMRSEEHTPELQYLMRIAYADF